MFKHGKGADLAYPRFHHAVIQNPCYILRILPGTGDTAVDRAGMVSASTALMLRVDTKFYLLIRTEFPIKWYVTRDRKDS